MVFIKDGLVKFDLLFPATFTVTKIDLLIRLSADDPPAFTTDSDGAGINIIGQIISFNFGNALVSDDDASITYGDLIADNYTYSISINNGEFTIFGHWHITPDTGDSIIPAQLGATISFTDLTLAINFGPQIEIAGDLLAVWGQILGTLSDQTDLQTALDLKASLVQLATKLSLDGSDTMAGNLLMGANNISGAGTITASANVAASTFNNVAIIATGSTSLFLNEAGVYVSIPVTSLNLQGNWDASTNTPTLASGGVGGVLNDYFIVSVAGTTLIDGISDWGVADWIVNTGTVWIKADNSDLVTSVFGRTGIVTAQAGDYNATQIGLGNVDNTSDANKPISTATQTALDLKEDDLGVPASDGFHLQSTTLGVRSWIAPPTTGTGDVVGPISATDNAFVLFDGVTGKLIKDSTVAIISTGVGDAALLNDGTYGRQALRALTTQNVNTAVVGPIDVYYGDPISNVVNFNLPPSADELNEVFNFINIDTTVGQGANYVSINPDGSETIGGSTASFILSGRNEVVTLTAQSANNWQPISQRTFAFAGLGMVTTPTIQAITTTPQLLTVFDTALANAPGRLVNNLANNSIDVLQLILVQDGYQINFDISFEFTNNVEVFFVLRFNGVDTIDRGEATGRGNNNTVSMGINSISGADAVANFEMFVSAGSAGDLEVKTIQWVMNRIGG